VKVPEIPRVQDPVPILVTGQLLSYVRSPEVWIAEKLDHGDHTAA
jgi:hypothetical protein